MSRLSFFKKFFIPLLTCSSFYLFAQGFNENFLSSLPANLQEDFKAALNDQRNEENIYSPDTRILKLEDALKEAERNLERLRTEIDNGSENENDKILRFGSQFFSTYQSSFLPINEPNPANDYMLDFGDQLLIQIVGQINDEFESVVNRDGTIYISLIGSLRVAGLSLNQAVSLIQEKLAESYVGIKSFVTLSELRDMNVLIVGNPSQPGMYTLPGGSSPLSLISVAGGIEKNGSFRSIHHKRNNVLLQDIDLYEILVKGNMKFEHTLRSGDVLIVNPKLPEIKVSGGVANKAIYEIKDGETVGDILEMAGIINPSENKSVYMERFNGSRIEKKAISLLEVSSLIAKAGDSVSVLNIEPNFETEITVKISGEVNLPGTYTLGKDSTLSELIRLAGSYTNHANPFAGVHIRKSSIESERQSIEKSYHDLIKFLVSTQIQSSVSDSYLAFLGLVKEYEPSGRIISEFELDKLKNEPNLDRVLQDGDVIHIPAFQNDVFVFGEVMNPGTHRYNPSLSPLDYINNSGRFSRSADKSRVIIVHPNGLTSVVESSFFNSFQKDDIVYPGSVIFIPRYIGKVDGINLASTVAPIMSSLAISLASLNSINN